MRQKMLDEGANIRASYSSACRMHRSAALKLQKLYNSLRLVSTACHKTAWRVVKRPVPHQARDRTGCQGENDEVTFAHPGA